jgi:hypothetical protein
VFGAAAFELASSDLQRFFTYISRIAEAARRPQKPEPQNQTRKGTRDRFSLLIALWASWRDYAFSSYYGSGSYAERLVLIQTPKENRDEVS